MKHYCKGCIGEKKWDGMTNRNTCDCPCCEVSRELYPDFKG